MHRICLLVVGGLMLPVTPIVGFAPSSFDPATPLMRTSAHPSPSSKSIHLRKASPVAFAQAPTPPPSRLLFSQTEEEGSKDKPFIRPAIHNSPFFRALTILYALLFALYQASSGDSGATALQKLGYRLLLSPKAAATLHLLSFSTWFGTVVYTTFVAGITMFKNLPRRVFGSLQSKLFPLYFQLCTSMIGIQILTLTSMPDILSKVSEVSLGISFAATLLNLLYLEPTSTQVMFDRYALEDDGKRDSDEYGKLAKSFGAYHGMSSLANLVALIGGIVHGVRLASGLVN
eukprot:g10416.t1 g10416   contig4:1838881-1839744(+)